MLCAWGSPMAALISRTPQGRQGRTISGLRTARWVARSRVNESLPRFPILRSLLSLFSSAQLHYWLERSDRGAKQYYCCRARTRKHGATNPIDSVPRLR
jgi:hypothetical protein